MTGLPTGISLEIFSNAYSVLMPFLPMKMATRFFTFTCTKHAVICVGKTLIDISTQLCLQHLPRSVVETSEIKVGLLDWSTAPRVEGMAPFMKG